MTVALIAADLTCKAVFPLSSVVWHDVANPRSPPRDSSTERPAEASLEKAEARRGAFPDLWGGYVLDVGCAAASSSRRCQDSPSRYKRNRRRPLYHLAG